LILQADERVLSALRVVLGGSPASRTYPSRIDQRTLKTAFRRRAHELHPDKARAVGLPERALAQRFHELKRAYDLLDSMLAAGGAILLDSVRPPMRPTEPARAPAPRATRRARESIHHLGAIPRRRLRFAQYLYYAGVIDWDMLVAAMRWQRRARPRIGEIAREMRFLSPEDICDILRRKLADERFGEAALRLRHLDRLGLFAVLARQRRFDRPIGRFFVERHVLTPGGLTQQLDRHWLHNLTCAAAEIRARYAYAAAG
jgi:hypothetical protein